MYPLLMESLIIIRLKESHKLIAFEVEYCYFQSNIFENTCAFEFIITGSQF